VPSQRGAAAIPVLLKRRVRSTLIDFTELSLPTDITQALADAFWHHFSSPNPRSYMVPWAQLRVFARFIGETGAVQKVADLDGGLLVRYVEWLNARCRPNGRPWAKSSRASAYTTLRKLLQWLERCRPGLLGSIEYPYNPFPWRNRDAVNVEKLPAVKLRAILKACEREIAALRQRRAVFLAERATAQGHAMRPEQSRVALVAAIETRYQGLIPAALKLRQLGDAGVLKGLKRFGGAKTIAPLLYPDSRTLLPYYLLLMIHAAGNPEPIAHLTCDCLQPLPLLSDRELLTWSKGRAGQVQRRSFRSAEPNEPPALVRELIELSAPLRSHAPRALRERLLLFRGVTGRVNGFVPSLAKYLIATEFASRHGLPRFALASIRPSVLSSFYRASGDLLAVKAVANHRSLATTIAYVDTPQVQAEHRVRVAGLQSSFIGHIERPPTQEQPHASGKARPPIPRGTAVSMFGFDCRDPLAGIAPGARRGELCTHFLGCFTCPNAVIPDDLRTLARLLQAREHLRSAAASIHPARWEAIYLPPLKILEGDLLPRFSTGEQTAAKALQEQLPPLPELR
jgi:hypothetical protein